MPKLLFTASTYSHLINFHIPYLRAFQMAGWETHAACGGAPMPLPATDKVFHVPFAKQITASGNIGCARQLGQLMEAEQYDLVITHTALAAFFTRLPLLGKRKRPRVITVVHGYLFGTGHSPKEVLLRMAERMTAPCTDLLLTMNTEDLATAQQSHLGKQVGLIPGMGVKHKDEVSEPEAADFRTQLGIASDAFLLTYAAEFSKRKNQAFLIQALLGLPERVTLLLLGRGDELAHCRTLALELGVGERVLFAGYVDRPAVCYLASQCAVSSSRSEGLPFNIMEAMGLGLPVIASDIKGHRDLLQEGCGLLYESENLDAFRGAVLRVMEDRPYAVTLGLSGQDAVTRFSLEQVFPQVMAAYGVETTEIVPSMV